MAYTEVLVFVQQGCPACHDILPVVDKIGRHYGACATTRVVDVHAEGLLADTMMVRETPTVIGCVSFRPTIRLVGANDAEARLAAFYQQLLADASCPIPSWKEV